MGPAGVLTAVVPLYCEGLALSASRDETRRELNRFLAEVERKAFRMARIALRHDDDALDAVQDAMLQLARRYAQRPAEEWRPLFYRILENRIRDLQRRRMVRGKVMALLPWRRDADEDMPDPVAEAPDHAPGPAEQVEGMGVIQRLEAALATLPARQREAFLLRNLEGLDVAETAAAMGCSDGSVKTHYFRAVQALKSQLGEFWT
jgi:RNA polymerase sigma-70 factor (ECF subfamily)